jgi:hypothetical protein
MPPVYVETQKKKTASPLSYVYSFHFTGSKEPNWFSFRNDRRTRLRLFSGVLEVGDEVVALLDLLDTSKGHLCSWNVLLWVLEVVELCHRVRSCHLYTW